MAIPRKIVRINHESPVLVEEPRSYVGSFFFWMLMLALCACGYWYYQHMEAQNEARRHRQEAKVAEKADAYSRTKPELHSQQRRGQMYSPQKVEKGHQGAGMGSTKPL